jgi:hypothetical protein
MFTDLPETKPYKDKGKLKAIALSTSVQLALVAAIIFIQMVMPEKLGEFRLRVKVISGPPLLVEPAVEATVKPYP